MKKRFRVEKEFEWTKVGSFEYRNPYTIAYIYPKDREPFIVKGGLNDVEPKNE